MSACAPSIRINTPRTRRACRSNSFRTPGSAAFSWRRALRRRAPRLAVERRGQSPRAPASIHSRGLVSRQCSRRRDWLTNGLDVFRNAGPLPTVAVGDGCSLRGHSATRKLVSRWRLLATLPRALRMAPPMTLHTRERRRVLPARRRRNDKRTGRSLPVGMFDAVVEPAPAPTPDSFSDAADSRAWWRRSSPLSSRRSARTRRSCRW
jgi:hypothetical protein